MTRKDTAALPHCDHLKIAAVLKLHRPNNYCNEGKQTIKGLEWNNLVYSMSTMLATDNCMFNWDTFTIACGVND